MLAAIPYAARADETAPGVGPRFDARGARVLSLDSVQHFQIRSASGVHRLPISPFIGDDFVGDDFALGGDRHGRPLAIYSRCPASGCRLFAYRLGALGGRPIAGVSDPLCEERSGREEHGVIVFVRAAPEFHPRRASRCDGLWVKRARQRPRRLIAGPFFSVPPELGQASAVFDLARGEVAYVLDRFRLVPDSHQRHALVSSELRVFPLAHPRRQRVLARAHYTFLGRDGFFGPSIDQVLLRGGYAYWSRSSTHGDSGPNQDDILRRPIAGGVTETAQRAGRDWVNAVSTGDYLFDFGIDGRSLLYSDTNGIFRLTINSNTFRRGRG